MKNLFAMLYAGALMVMAETLAVKYQSVDALKAALCGQIARWKVLGHGGFFHNMAVAFLSGLVMAPSADTVPDYIVALAVELGVKLPASPSPPVPAAAVPAPA